MKYLSIHHTAVENTGSPQLYAVNRYHQSKWNMKSRLGWYVGYHYFIDVDGTTTQTRSWTEETIANKGHNCDIPERCDTISVCLADNYNVSHWIDPDQYNAIKSLIADIKKHYPDIKVVGHRDLQTGRTCPGTNITQEHFDDWSKPLNDDVDTEKQQKIEELQSAIDRLRALIAMLRSLLNK